MGMFDQQPGMFADPLGFGAGAQGGLANILGDYLRSVVSGQIAAGGALGQNHYDPQASFAQNALNPKAIENATDIAMSLGTGPIKAYHASPYDFDKFDLSKIGTGQGAQSYGHGIYAAESPAVSGKGGQYDLEFTAKNLGKPDLNQGEASILRMLRADRSDMDIIGDLARNGYSFDEAVSALNRVRGAQAKIYEVNINASPEQFLNWDKPLSGQSDVVRQVFGKMGVPENVPVLNTIEPLGGGNAYQRLAFNLEKPLPPDPPGTPAGWGFVDRGVGDPLAASRALNQAGIPGIRYLDQGSRGAGQGTSNYVVFDPELITILRKYGILGPIAAPGALAPFMGDQQQ